MRGRPPSVGSARAHQPQQGAADAAFGHTTAGLLLRLHPPDRRLRRWGKPNILRAACSPTRPILQRCPRHLRRRNCYSSATHPAEPPQVRCSATSSRPTVGGAGPRPGRGDMGDPYRHPARRQTGHRRIDRDPPSACRWPRRPARSRSNFEEESTVERLNELNRGKGPEKCIDAVGLEAHGIGRDVPRRLNRWMTYGADVCAR